MYRIDKKKVLEVLAREGGKLVVCTNSRNWDSMMYFLQDKHLAYGLVHPFVVKPLIKNGSIRLISESDKDQYGNHNHTKTYGI